MNKENRLVFMEGVPENITADEGQKAVTGFLRADEDYGDAESDFKAFKLGVETQRDTTIAALNGLSDDKLLLEYGKDITPNETQTMFAKMNPQLATDYDVWVKGGKNGAEFDGRSAQRSLGKKMGVKVEGREQGEVSDEIQEKFKQMERSAEVAVAKELRTL
ncbi:MAG: hypothetical protein V1679_02110, partial [Candidatus Peregrinibacteria bacterium]